MPLFPEQPIMGSEDPNKKKDQMDAAPGSIIQGAGGTTVSTGQGLGGPQKTTSGRAANLQSYLKANTENKMGEQVGQKVQSSAAQVGQNISQAKQQLQQSAQPEQQRLAGYQQYAQQIQQDPTQLNDQQIQEFQKYRTGEYQAPEVQNLSDLQAQSQRAQELAGMAGSEAGRFGLLREYFGKPTYSTGQQRLDQLLLQANRPQAQALTSAAQQARMQAMQDISGLEGERTNIQSALGQQAQDVQGQAGTLLGEQRSALDTSVQQQLEQAQQQSKQQEDLYNRYIKQFGEGAPVSTMPTDMNDTSRFVGRDPNKGMATPELISAYQTLDNMQRQGLINPQQYDALNKQAEKITSYGATSIWDALKGGLTYNTPENLTKEGITSQDQRNRLQALQRLSGEDPTQFQEALYKQGVLTEDPNKLNQAAEVGKSDMNRIAKEIEFGKRMAEATGTYGGRGTEGWWNFRNQLTNELNQKYGGGDFFQGEGDVSGRYDQSTKQRYDMAKKLGLV